MYPLLKPGDIVVYKQLIDIEEGLYYGRMYLISVKLEDEVITIVNYINRSELGSDYIRLEGYNTQYSYKDVKKKSVNILALIKASIRIDNML
jgi:hypothetical protein